MTKTGRIRLAVTALAAAALVAGCGSSNSSGGGGGGGGGAGGGGSAPDSITIGATLPLTGSGAPFGKLFEDALNIAVDRINSQGGVGENHAKINVKVIDDQALAAPAVMATTQLIKKDNALVVATAYNDPPLAQYKVGQRYGVPIMNGGGNDPAMRNKPFLWTNSSILTAEAEPAFQYAKDHGVNSVGLLAASNYTDYDINVYHQLANKVFGGDQKLVTFPPDATNVTSQLQQLAAAKPDAISPLSSGTLTLTVAKNMSQLGMKETVLGTGATLTEPPEIVKQPAWDGAIAAVISEKIPGWLEQAVQKNEKTHANAYHVFFANIPYVLKDAIEILEKQGKDVTGQNINALFEQYAKAGKPFQGISGPVQYLPDHTVAHSYNIVRNENGAFKVLKSIPAGSGG